MKGSWLLSLLALVPSIIACGGSKSDEHEPERTSRDSADAGVELSPFSFFVTSLRSLQQLSGSQTGFGGDLRFGETGAGAGLTGADRICGEIAERSMPGAKAKRWHAFLSAATGADGAQVDAIDRIEGGPWYDRLGRIVAESKEDLIAQRPSGADAAIKDDLPNEEGIPNHAPDLIAGPVDNHDVLTGSNAEGRLYGPTATCDSWTSADGATGGQPRVGHSWPRNFGDLGALFGDAGPSVFPPGLFGDGGLPGFLGGFDFRTFDGAHWISALNEAGCAPGANIIEMGPPNAANPSVGSGGGYGGFYCFASVP
jgi:hypothetical protein